MQTVLDIGKWLLANWAILLAALVGLLNAAIAVALIIPGPQPEKALQSVVDFLERFSKK